MNPREQRLRDEFINGDIEADEFEERLEAILRGEPLRADRLPVFSDAPGAIHYYRPIGTGWFSPETPRWYDAAQKEIHRLSLEDDS